MDKIKAQAYKSIRQGEMGKGISKANYLIN